MLVVLPACINFPDGGKQDDRSPIFGRRQIV
jgi:hypothetical protein